ncbi:hypothetical protein HUT11_35595 (plasmid) [Streptomyces seoulensis]|nr:hypothetical protein HUT11_35595 [Streptomyces seoulensis]
MTPYGCLICGEPHANHGWQFDSEAGLHQWMRPTQKQIKQRMQARRTARLTTEPTKYHATTGWAPDHTGESAEPYCADCKTDGCHRWARIQTRLDQQRWGTPIRTKHPLHVPYSVWGGHASDLPF